MIAQGTVVCRATDGRHTTKLLFSCVHVLRRRSAMLTLSSSLSMYPWPQVSGRPDLSLVGTEAARRSGTVARRITSARAFVRACPGPGPCLSRRSSPYLCLSSLISRSFICLSRIKSTRTNNLMLLLFPSLLRHMLARSLSRVRGLCTYTTRAS